MATDLATSRLIATPARFAVSLATELDDAELRALLRQTPMEGRIRLTLERDPDFFAAAAIDGDPHDTVCARDAGRIIAMGSRAVRPVFVNGAAARLGYLSQLRVAATHRPHARHLVRTGFELLRQTRTSDQLPFDITTIIADNAAARRILTAGLPGMPEYRQVEPLATFILPPRRPAAPANVTAGSPLLQTQIVDCLQRNARRHQFAPIWTAQNLQLPGLSWKDFHVVLSGDRVIGCLALWDQRPFKQTVVRGYTPWLQRSRWLFGLPPVGAVMPMAFLSHIAVDADDPAVFADLLAAALGASRGRSLVLGMGARHPLARVVRQHFRPHEVVSVIYVVGEPGHMPQLDGRIAHPEVAVL